MSLKWLNQNISMKKDHYQERIDGVQRSHKINNNFLVFKREDTSIKSKALSKLELDDCRDHFNSSMALHLDSTKNPESSPQNTTGRLHTTAGNVSSRANTNMNQPATTNHKAISASMDYSAGLLNANLLPSRGNSGSPMANLKGYRGVNQDTSKENKRDLHFPSRSPKRNNEYEPLELRESRARTAAMPEPKPVYTKLMTVNIESRKKKKDKRTNTTISPHPQSAFNTNPSVKNTSILDISADDKITGTRKLRQMSSINQEKLHQSMIQQSSKEQLDESSNMNIRISSIPPQIANVHTVIRRLSEVTGHQNTYPIETEEMRLQMNNPYKKMFLQKMTKKLQQFSSGSGVSIAEAAGTPLLKKRQHMIPNSFIPMNANIINQRNASMERGMSGSPKGASAVLEDKSGTYYEGKAFRPFEMRKAYVNGNNKFLAGYLAEVVGKKNKKNNVGGVVVIVEDSHNRRPGRFERYDSRLNRDKDRSADFDYSLLSNKREMKKQFSNSFKVGSVQYLESLANNEVNHVQQHMENR